MGYEINWHTFEGNPLLRHPLYEKYRLKTLGAINRADVVADLNGIIMDNNAAPVVAYLSWLVRCKALVA
jgi:hypothetical protein